ncbi:cytochrome P450 [Micromonospora sp. WMMD882]|uniref:cytochrome P450 n=1 Tax=Micromonospora sp. WMMD882 TaxID=3015151 RepID=UPI00248C34D5|nr:cytochrome P450 [Micromonospora sp. WMMD882]WBB80674.1 cytochrome P450 [Micromonospora sp. WMMD882]
MSELPAFPFPVDASTEPPPQYAAMRAQPRPGRVRLPGGREALVLTRYPDVRLVLADRRFSRSAYTSGTLFARSSDSLPLITADPPVHTRRRGTVAPAFTAHRVARMRSMVEEVARSQLAEFTAGPTPADVVGRFTVPFTLRVMCRVMGVPEEDMPRFGPWVDAMMSIDKFPADTVRKCHQEMHGYFADLVDTVQAGLDRGDAPTGLIARMLSQERDDRRLSRAEAVVLSAGMLMAGYETTSNVLGAVLYEILRDPALTARALAGPATRDPLIEEVLRHVCANGSGGVPHVATEDVLLSDGSVVAAGEVVVPVPDAANRDPDVFADPDRLDPDRAENPHVAFGYGAHHCLGAELARLELRVGVDVLLTSLPGLRIAVPDTALRWRTDMYVRGLWELPLRWDGAAGG